MRYRRGIGIEAKTSELIAAPAPKAASTSEWSPAPPCTRSRRANGMSTSIGPIVASTRMVAKNSVDHNHGVRHM